MGQHLDPRTGQFVNDAGDTPASTHYGVWHNGQHLTVAQWDPNSNQWINTQTLDSAALTDYVANHPGQWEIWQGDQKIHESQVSPMATAGPGGQRDVPGSGVSDVVSLVNTNLVKPNATGGGGGKPYGVTLDQGTTPIPVPTDTGGGGGLDFGGLGGSGASVATQAEQDLWRAEAADLPIKAAETERANRAQEAQAALDLEAVKRKTLADTIANIFGTDVSAADSARSAASADLRTALPEIMTPQLSHLIGQLIPGLGGDFQTTNVPVDFKALGPSDTAKMQADAEAKAHNILGLADGGRITRLYHAAEGDVVGPTQANGDVTTTHADGTTTTHHADGSPDTTGVAVGNVDPLLKIQQQAMSDLRDYANEFGTVPQAVIDATMKYYGIPPGTIHLPPSLTKQTLDETNFEFTTTQGEKVREFDSTQKQTKAIADADRASNERIASGNQANALAIAQGHDTTSLQVSRQDNASRETIARNALAENARQFDASLSEDQRKYLSNLAANPRKVIEAAYYQAGQTPGASAEAIQTKILSDPVHNILSANSKAAAPAAPVPVAPTPAPPAAQASAPAPTAPTPAPATEPTGVTPAAPPPASRAPFTGNPYPIRASRGLVRAAGGFDPKTYVPPAGSSEEIWYQNHPDAVDPNSGRTWYQMHPELSGHGSLPPRVRSPLQRAVIAGSAPGTDLQKRFRAGQAYLGTDQATAEPKPGEPGSPFPAPYRGGGEGWVAPVIPRHPAGAGGVPRFNLFERGRAMAAADAKAAADKAAAAPVAGAAAPPPPPDPAAIKAAADTARANSQLGAAEGSIISEPGTLAATIESALMRRMAKGGMVGKLKGKGHGKTSKALQALLSTLAQRIQSQPQPTTPISGAMMPQPGPANPMPGPMPMAEGGIFFRAAKGIETIPAQGKGKPAVHFKKGALHEELGVPAGEKIPEKKMAAARSGSLGPLAKKRALFAKNFLHHSAGGSVVPGPAIVLVGEGKDGSGIRNGTHEYVHAPPGTIIAPGVKGETPTMDTAMAALHRQIKSSVRRAARGMKVAKPKEGSAAEEKTEDAAFEKREDRALRRASNAKSQPERAANGAAVTPEKAKLILSDGKIRGKPITSKQRRFFGAMAGGEKELKKAAYGYMRRADTGYIAPTLAPGQGQAKRGSYYDPLGGANPELRAALTTSDLPTWAGFNNMSGTQRGLWEAGLSAGQVEPTDVEDWIKRGFQGFGAQVGAGQTARVGRSF